MELDEIRDRLGIRTWSDARAYLYTLAPLVIGYLVSVGVLDNDKAALWGGLVAAVLAPALAAVNSTDGFRTWFYGVLAAGQAVVVGVYGMGTDASWSPIVATITAILGAGVAAANVSTSTDDSSGRHSRP